MIQLDERNPILLAAYVAAHDAMESSAGFKVLEAEALALFARMQARAATRVGKTVKVSMLIGLFGDKAMPAIALLERMDCLELQPCKERFRVRRPFWFASSDVEKLYRDSGKLIQAAIWAGVIGQPFDPAACAGRLAAGQQTQPPAPPRVPSLPPPVMPQTAPPPDPAYLASMSRAIAAALGAACRSAKRRSHDA